MSFHPKTPPVSQTHSPGTPRHHKVGHSSGKSTQELKTCLPQCISTPENIRSTLKADLGLSFEPDEWQAHTIHRILQGYDGMVVAATGLGKSLVFEGTAKLAGSGKAVIVICPLKALECNQVQHAINKGLVADAINKDTEKTLELW
ncbi:hypothetical protein BT96DRAFT_1044080 [Gymnopus androsaceus JB14]|uniref:DNA 3'-5' helicase n=1 Tax=Gymnopus androsaceus JB14 TaxID=1447944 RepID=A0A6A4IDF2_9AGAR|nr:hypothetical protein BT96DRAFT_1044080 [Gymnopus androsaceus JB14]